MPAFPSSTSKKMSALALVASSIGLFAEIVKNVSSIGDQIDQHFFITVSALWAGTVLFAFTTPLGKPRQTKVRRYHLGCVNDSIAVTTGTTKKYGGIQTWDIVSGTWTTFGKLNPTRVSMMTNTALQSVPMVALRSRMVSWLIRYGV